MSVKKSDIFARAVLALLLTAALLFTNISAAENTGVDGETNGIEELISGVVDYMEKRCGADSVDGWISGGLADGAGSTSEWFVIGLCQYPPAGSHDFSPYAEALKSYISTSRMTSAASKYRCALALIACGQSGDPFVVSTLSAQAGEQGVQGQGMMSSVFALHLQNNNTASGKSESERLVGVLLSQRLSDGGWALTGEYSDVDVTAMTVQTLAPHYAGNEDVRTAVDGAVAFLSSKQLSDGGFSTYGAENPESAAQVIAALASLGIDPLHDERFIKNGRTALDSLKDYRNDDGSFCHAKNGGTNDSATCQAFYSLVALWRVKNGLGPIYVFDSVSDAAAPDSAQPVTTATMPPVTTATKSPVTTMAAPPATTATAAGESLPVNSSSGYKLPACIVIAGAALAVCLALWLAKKRNVKNYIFTIAAAALLVIIVLATDIQTAKSYYSDTSDKAGTAGAATLTIRCDTITDLSTAAYIPADGVILAKTEFAIDTGETVYELLIEAAKKHNIQIDSGGNSAGAGRLIYISGINHLYQFDFGDLSGWIYHVNGAAPSVGCGDYVLHDGDNVEWLYSRELGNDLN